MTTKEVSSTLELAWRAFKESGGDFVTSAQIADYCEEHALPDLRFVFHYMLECGLNPFLIEEYRPTKLPEKLTHSWYSYEKWGKPTAHLYCIPDEVFKFLKRGVPFELGEMCRDYESFLECVLDLHEAHLEVVAARIAAKNYSGEGGYQI